MKTVNAGQQKFENILSRIQPTGRPLKNFGLHLLRKNKEFAGALPDQIRNFGNRPDDHLLANLSNPLMGKLAPFFERVSFAVDQCLYQQGEPVKYLYFPESAVISEFRIIEDGGMIETALIGSEGLTGFSAFLSQSAAGCWTQALIGGSALRIKADLLRHEFTHNPELQSLFFGYLDRYINQISQRSFCHSYHSVEQRYCTWLLLIDRRSSYLKIPLTQERIARSLGVHRPSLSSVAKNLQDRLVIKYRRGNITILDTPALEKAACDCHRQIDLQGSAPN